MKNKREFQEWMDRSGYTDINDWNMQQIGWYSYYFIKHNTENKYAFIKRLDNFRDGTDANCKFEIILTGWIDYNGWN